MVPVAMILAEFLPPRPHLLWHLSRQLGVHHAIVKCAPQLTGLNPPWDRDALAGIQRDLAQHDLTLHGLEGDQFDMTRIKLGLPGRDEDLERYCQMLRNMGELGIPLLCYNFMAGIGWHRSDVAHPTRGGALTSRFDVADVPATLTEFGQTTEEQMWENYACFLRAVLPTAERHGVQMGVHPDDPPLPKLRGLARLFYKPENFEKALSLVSSPSHGVTFCQANFKLMGCDVMHWSQRWAAQNRIFFVHFRDVNGSAERFEETFHDAGPTDMPRMLLHYHEIGFTGAIRVDHVPTLAGETNENPGYMVQGRLFALGYIKGIGQALRIPMQ